MNKRTIIAPATAPGRGGISVIRMSGTDARKISEEMCGQRVEVSRLKKCNIKSSDGLTLDSGMVVFFESPNSYTGDDVVEFHCHGNPTIVDLVIEEALRLGAVVAEPGEFTKTAFLNDKIDLAQAESVADLIDAQSKSAVVAANSSLSGDFSKKINLLIDGVINARVFIEANIDFPEEEIDEKSFSVINSDLCKYRDEINDLLSVVKGGVRLREGYSVAIIGPPNAGKSSLLNLLAREDVAITSETPGTTRDLVRTSVNLGGVVVEFIDTAGVRENPADLIEAEGISRSKEVIRKSNLSILVQDVTDQRDFDFELTDHITVLNKSDLLQGDSLENGRLYLSCTSGEGVEDLLKVILSKLGVDEGVETAYLSRKRHVVSLQGAKLLIEETVVSLNEGQALELVAENLRSAHHMLGDILRPMSADDLLGEIFSEFCIGK